MIAGTGKPRIRCYIEEEMISIDFTPAKFFLMSDKDPISANLIRNAVRSVERKIFIKGKYLSLKYRFYNLTYAEISVLKKLRSRTGLFTPHIDFNKTYYAVFESVKALPEKDLMDRYIVEIVIRSVNYQEYAVPNTYIAYQPDGLNDWVDIENPNVELTGGQYSIAMTVMHRPEDELKGYPNFSTYFYFDLNMIDVYDNGSCNFRSSNDIGNYHDLATPAGTFVKDGIFHNYIFTSDSIAGQMFVYKDNMQIASYSGTVYVKTVPLNMIRILSNRYNIDGSAWGNSGLYKNIILKAGIFSAIERGYLEAGNISAITNKVMWQKWNEQKPAGTAPFTDLSLDYGDTGLNKGTPKGIDKETFFVPEIT